VARTLVLSVLVLACGSSTLGPQSEPCSIAYPDYVALLRGQSETGNVVTISRVGDGLMIDVPLGERFARFALRVDGDGFWRLREVDVVDAGTAERIGNGDSVKEFAFSVRLPEDSSLAWVPRHGNVGGVIAVDSVWVYLGSGPSRAPDQLANGEASRIRMVQWFNARRPNGGPALWAGTIEHTFTPDGLQVEGSFAFITDVWVSVGYPVMLAGQDVDWLTVDGHNSYPVGASTYSETRLDFVPPSAIAWRNEGTAFAIKIGEGAAPLDALVTDRPDGVSKFYWRALMASTVAAGSTFAFSAELFAGEFDPECGHVVPEG
jgi:hypothetical protein